MHLLKRLRLGRGVVAICAGLLLIAGLATPASATSQSLEMTLVGGSLTLSSSSGTNNLGGSPQCSNTTDDEYPGDPRDTFIDYPADPQCSSPFDNSERTAGFQAAVPISMHGTIDDVTGAFSVPTSGFNWPTTTLYITSPLPAFVVNAVAADSALTGTIDPSTGASSLTSSDFTFHTQVCLTPGASCGGGNPPPPYGTGSFWTVDCNIDVHPTAMSSSEPAPDLAGSPYFGPAGVVTVADNDFSIPTPTDSGGPESGTCAGFGPAFGFPTTAGTANNSRLAIQLSTNKAIAQAKSITLGNGSVIETGPNLLTAKPGTSKITFPVTVNTAPLVDLTFSISTGSFAPAPGWAIESTKPVATPNSDFTSLDTKVGKIKAGKTSGKLSVTVNSDALTEGTELMLASISSPSDPTYTVVHGTALGTIYDNAGGAKVSVLGGETSEGSNAGVSPTKPATVSAAFPLVLSSQQLTDVTVKYCTFSITAEENDLTKPLTAPKIKDFAPAPICNPGDPKVKIKVIKAGKLTSSIAIKVNQDSTVEPDEAFAVQILSVTGPASADSAHSLAIGRIIADD